MTLLSDHLPKPRIKRGMWYKWKCVYMTFDHGLISGYGDTPHEAYNDWAYYYRIRGR